MSVPRHLVSIVQKVEACRWWKLKHIKLPYRYNGTQYITQYECTKTVWCQFNTTDSRLGGCVIAGNVSKIPRELRP